MIYPPILGVDLFSAFRYNDFRWKRSKPTKLEVDLFMKKVYTYV